jgi:MoxR-like ATPase
MEAVREWSERITKNIETVFLGKREIIEKLLVGVLCGGHVLLEDVPGVGKTVLARALAAVMGGRFSRIQCTPDLLPADILGVSVYNPKSGEFSFREGPIMANVVLVDEINRATPRTQSALLEVMAENQITLEGRRLDLPQPFFLIATENPVEFEGTFPLPEAQKDRFFFTLSIGYPDRETEARIVEEQRRTDHPVRDLVAAAKISEVLPLREEVTKVFVHKDILDYALQIIRATREDRGVRIGGSPRASLALYKSAQALAALRGRDYVAPEDVKEMALSVLIQRIILEPGHVVRGQTAERVIHEVLEKTPVPVLEGKGEEEERS